MLGLDETVGLSTHDAKTNRPLCYGQRMAAPCGPGGGKFPGAVFHLCCRSTRYLLYRAVGGRPLNRCSRVWLHHCYYGISVGVALGITISVLVSRQLGRDDMARVRDLFSSTWFFGLSLMICVSVLLILLARSGSGYCRRAEKPPIWPRPICKLLRLVCLAERL